MGDVVDKRRVLFKEGESAGVGGYPYAVVLIIKYIVHSVSPERKRVVDIFFVYIEYGLVFPVQFPYSLPVNSGEQRVVGIFFQSQYGLFGKSLDGGLGKDSGLFIIEIKAL